MDVELNLRKSNRRLWDDYREWLIDRMNFNYDAVNYSRLLYIMHNKEFEWVIPRDENRAEDGLSLRVDFLDELGVIGRFEGEPTIFEVLVALAIRMDDEYVGDPNDPNPGIIFFDFLESLGLGRYKDRNLTKKKEENVINILDDWMYRKHDIYLFDVDDPKNLRDLEIWSQMQYYLNEKYN